MSVATYQSPYRVSLLAAIVLCLSLIQGTSTSLTLAYHFKHFSPYLESAVNMMWGLLYVVSLVGLTASFGINWITWVVRYRLLLTLLLVGTAFSAMWSIDPGLSIERTVHLLGSTLIALYIGFMIPLNRILSIAAVVFGLLMSASIVAVFVVPDLGIERYEGRDVWRGIMTSKNTLGFWSAIAVLLYASMLTHPLTLNKKLLYSIGLLIALTVLVNSVSATSVLSLVIGLLVMSYLFIAHRFQLGYAATMVLGTFFVALAIFSFYNIDTAELIGRSGDLTGRGDVWSQTWQLIMQKPLTGYGYGTIWYPTDESLWIQQHLTDFTWKVFHAHNGLLQLASEIGMPLTLLALLMIVQQLIEIIYCQYQRQQLGVLFVLGFTIALLVSNYSEARLVVNREMYWILFVALPISMLQQVSVVLKDSAFNPIPAPLPKRTQQKLATMASDRYLRQKLKARLRSRLEAPDDNSVDAHIVAVIEQVSDADSRQRRLAVIDHSNKLARRRQKIG